MRHTFLIAAVLVLEACGTGWDDVPGARVRPISDDPELSTEAWEAEVVGAMAEWNDALEPSGCDAPFSLDLGGPHTVHLVSASAWHHAPCGLNSDACTFADDPGMPSGGMYVRANAPTDTLGYRPVLLHELGHAIGLGHVPREVGASVMCHSGGCQSAHLTELDVRNAREALNCAE